MTPLERLGEEARARLDGDVPPEVDAAGRARLVAAVARPRAPRRAWPFAAAAAAVLAVAAAGALVIRGRTPPVADVGFTVEGAPIAENRWVRAGDGPATLRFREGSTVALAARSSARVIEGSADGAEVLLESGSARVHVQHREGTRWTLRAGPYTVRVTGTEFDLDWEPASEVLRLTLHTGSLEVLGPAPGGLVRLGAGEILEGRPEGLFLRHASAPPVPSATVESPALPASVVASALPSSAASAAGPAAISWTRLVATGSFKTVLEEADARGVDAVLASAGPSDLLALADAARYGRRGDLASRALAAVRKRFPASREANVATFLVARAADDAGRTGEAIELFDAYLAAGGSFAAEALGRKMSALQRAGRIADARVVARQYLLRHPKGPHAKLARDLSGDAP